MSYMNPLEDKKQVMLTVFSNEPMARLAEQRLQQENVPCVVRSLGPGAGIGIGVMNLPHALYVKGADEMLARDILELEPAEIMERKARPAHRPSSIMVAMLIITVALLLFGVVELLADGALR